MLAGAIPTEIGQLAQLKNLDLTENQLIGACTGNSLDYNGIRVYNNLKKTSLLRRYNPDGAGALHGYGGPPSAPERVDWQALLLKFRDGYTSKLWLTKCSIKKITGPIPTELGRCSAMECLSIFGNQLSGMSILCSSCPVW